MTIGSGHGRSQPDLFRLWLTQLGSQRRSGPTLANNEPTTSIFAPALTPAVVGQLVALYEHITFTQDVIWGINSFDQWGVELGKQLALRIAPAVEGDDAVLAAQDASTQALIAYYKANRK